MEQNMMTIDMSNAKVCPALCLDLDGTIRYSKSGKFISGPDDIVLFEGVEAKLWEYREKGYLIFGVSNQGGVAFGLKTPVQEVAEIEATIALFEIGKCPFHAIKTCWHHEKGKHPILGHRSLFRKPDIGMLALCEFEAFNAGYVVDWDNSIFVGDRPEDQECARRAAISFQWAWEFFGRPAPEPEGEAKS